VSESCEHCSGGEGSGTILSPFRGGGQDTVIMNDVITRPRNECGQFLNQFDPLHHDVRLSASPGRFHPIDKSSSGCFLQPLVSQRWSRGILAQGFQAFSIRSPNRDIGVDAESLIVCASQDSGWRLLCDSKRVSAPSNTIQRTRRWRVDIHAATRANVGCREQLIWIDPSRVGPTSI